MKELINWLIRMEDQAGNLYLDAAKIFEDDVYLNRALISLAEDEAAHFHILSSAARYLETQDLPVESEVKVEKSFREQIEAPLEKYTALIREGEFSKEDLAACVADIEFSEWNDLFSYTVSSFRDYSRHFQHIAAEMQTHRKKAEKIISRYISKETDVSWINSLPSVWNERILIIDDSYPLLELFASFFEQEYQVDTAGNGIEALEKFNKNYYNLVISDVEMPKMDGISFYREAVKIDPQLSGKFIFISATEDSEKISHISQLNLPKYNKPIDLMYLREKAIELITASN